MEVFKYLEKELEELNKDLNRVKEQETLYDVNSHLLDLMRDV